MGLMFGKRGKSYVDKLDVRKYLDISLFKTTANCFTHRPDRLLPDLSCTVSVFKKLSIIDFLSSEVCVHAFSSSFLKYFHSSNVIQ